MGLRLKVWRLQGLGLRVKNFRTQAILADTQEPALKVSLRAVGSIGPIGAKGGRI